MKKLKVLNFEGEKFWFNHFKFFHVAKYFFTELIDFVEDKMYSAELVILLSGSYISNLNTVLLGMYEAYAMCEPLYPEQLSVPSFLMILSPFSVYIHHFYFLVFLGNLKKSPYWVTLLSALFCAYHFTLVLVDTLYCGPIGEIQNRGLFVYAYFNLTLTGLTVIYWVFVLVFSDKTVKNLGFLNICGKFFRFLLKKICRFGCCRNFYSVIAAPFEYPMRIKTAGGITLGLCLTNALAVRTIQVIFYTYGIYKVIDDLQGYVDYLRDQPYEDIFVLIRLHKEYDISVDTGIKLLNLLISALLPIFPCVTIAITVGFCVSMASIINLFYHYKRIILQIRSEGPESNLLNEIWKFRTYNSIFFCTQFIINAFFLGYIFAISVFIVCYMLSFKEIMIFSWDYLKSRNIGFYIAFVPLILGNIYFPFLINKNNYIRNKAYFSFWETWYFLIGNFGAVLKAAARYFIGIGSILVLGFRVQVSIMPSPFDHFDTLYVGFYATILIHCMRENLIPRPRQEDLISLIQINSSFI